MKIREAQELYREQIRAYRAQKNQVSSQLQNLRSRMENIPGGKEKYGSEAATLELTLEALDEKQEEYQDYLSELTEQYCGYWNGRCGRGICGRYGKNDGGGPASYERGHCAGFG